MGLKIPSYDGAWKLASRAVSLDHLWNAVRVQGGAYGVGMAARGSLFCGFYSYRDPAAPPPSPPTPRAAASFAL